MYENSTTRSESKRIGTQTEALFVTCLNYYENREF
jgi:hypothetical protein